MPLEARATPRPQRLKVPRRFLRNLPEKTRPTHDTGKRRSSEGLSCPGDLIQPSTATLATSATPLFSASEERQAEAEERAGKTHRNWGVGQVLRCGTMGHRIGAEALLYTVVTSALPGHGSFAVTWHLLSCAKVLD